MIRFPMTTDQRTEYRRLPSERSEMRLAPVACVSMQEAPSAGHVALVARDMDGRIRCRIEIERDDRVIRWFVKALRCYLATFYGASDIRLVG